MWTHFIIAQVFHKVKCLPASLDGKYKWLLARMSIKGQPAGLTEQPGYN